MDGKENKVKGKKSQSKADSSKGSKKKEFSDIKFFHYHEPGHYAMTFPHNKANKNPSVGLEVEALTSQFDLDFTLITCMVTLVMGSMWYLDNGASFHMTGNK